MWRGRFIWLPLIALAAAACGAGGGGSSGIASLQDQADGDAAVTTTTAAADPEQAMLDFTQCMRDHGIDMPDPEISTAGGGFSFGITVQGGDGGDPDDAEMRKMLEADQACRHFLEGVVQQFERPDMTEMQDQMLAFSQCMRDQGIDYPDPEFSEDGGVTLIGPGPGEGGFDPSDPDFQAAQEACQEIFGGEGPMTIVGGDPGAGAGFFVGPGGPAGDLPPDEGGGEGAGG